MNGALQHTTEITLDQLDEASARIFARQMFSLLIHLCEGRSIGQSFAERLITMVWKRGDYCMNGIAIASKKSGIKGIRPPIDFSGVPGLRGHVGTVRKRPWIARKKRSRPKDKKRPSSKRFGTLGAQRPRNVSATTKPLFPFRPWCPVCVEAKGHRRPTSFCAARVVNMRFLLSRLITNHPVNPAS